MHGERKLTKPEAITWDVADDEGDAAVASELEVMSDLEQTFTAATYQPPMLPAVALELVTLSSKADVKVEQLIDLLEKDVLLAGRVLALCRSAAYAGRMDVRSLKSAVVRLGLRVLRDVVMEVVMNLRVFRSPGYGSALEQIHRHSTAVAHLCRVVSRYSPFESEYAFLCGLLHDVGYSAALVALGDARRGKPPRPLANVWPVLHLAHERIAEIIAHKWQLPEELTLVIANHHTLAIGGVVHPVAAVVAVADRLATDAGVGPALPPLDQGPDADERTWQRAVDALRFDDKLLKLIRQDTKAALAHVSAAAHSPG